MAKPSAVKRHRQSLKRRDRNRSARSTIRTSIKNTFTLVAEGKAQEAQKAGKETIKLLDKAAVHGLLHRNNASRHISQIDRKLATLSK